MFPGGVALMGFTRGVKEHPKDPRVAPSYTLDGQPRRPRAVPDDMVLQTCNRPPLPGVAPPSGSRCRRPTSPLDPASLDG